MSVSATSRISLFYFVSAMSVGAVNGFAGLWLTSRGFSADAVGVIFAVPILAVLLVGVPVGRLADRLSDWRQVIVGGALLSAVIPLALLCAESFAAVLVVWTLAVVTQVAIIPVTDAAAMRRSRREDGDFGRLYAWKTVGYLATVLGTGLLVERYGIAAFLPAFLVLSALRGVCALPLPRFRDTASRTHQRGRAGWVNLRRPALFLPLLAWVLVHCTHSVLNAFLGVLWVDQGVTAAMVGVLIAFSGLVETGVFVAFRTYLRGVPSTTLILIACLAGVLRWGGFAMAPPVEVLFVLQLLHGATYAVGFLACTNLIADLTRDDVAAEAQSAFGILSSGLSIAALLVFGSLAQLWGAQAFWISAGLAGLGALLVAARRVGQTPDQG